MRKLLLCLACLGTIALAQQTPSFNLVVTGEKTWTIRLGFGAAGLLSDEGLSPGQPALTQTLRAEVEGKALGFLTLRASFNDQLGPGFQEFIVTADQPPWKGELGRFVVGTEGEGLGVYNKRVLGARGEYVGETLQASALVTRLEGISESRTFRGEQGLAETTYTTENPEQPWLPAPYTRSVEGLAHWPLRAPFVDGLSEAGIRVETGPPLWQFLAQWALGYLQEDLTSIADSPLREGQYLVLRADDGDWFATRVSPPSLARRRVQDAIDLHNTRLGLKGDARRTYPFIEGSELETRFLDGLLAFLSLRVDDENHPLKSAQRRQFLLLAERDVVEGSVEVFLRPPGETDYIPSTDPRFADYRWTLFASEGVIRIRFPDGFFQGGAIRVQYGFRLEGTAFSLGLSVVPGSERVQLNGRRLSRGIEYSIDYEVGLLIMFSPLRLEDELRVDFERQRGSLGVAVEYERSLIGIVLRAPGWDRLRVALYRAMDFGAPTPTSRTMPNTHSLAALSLAGTIADWAYSLSVSGSENVFPFDDNARTPSRNQINAITAAVGADGAYVAFAHQNGLTVFRDGAFSGYSGPQGLSGRAALALLALPEQLLVGTDGGLTVVRLTEPAPFDRVRSWVRVSQTDGVPGVQVLALAQGGDRVYLATESHVASFRPDESESPRTWAEISLPEGDPVPSALLWHDGLVYLGTDIGLFVSVDGVWERRTEAGGSVHALAARGSEVFVASNEGIRILRGDAGAGWLVVGQRVQAMAIQDGVIWYATEDGLWREGQPTPTVSGAITAVAAAPGGIWAGSEAGRDFALDLWRVGETVQRFRAAQTRIDGRDLARFADIPASEHTRYGMTGILSLTRTVGDWTWELRLASRHPGYQEIGRPGRSDAHGVGLGARYAQGPHTLNLQLRWDAVDLTTRPSGRLAGSLDWQWTSGHTASLTLTPTLTGGGLVPLAELDMGWRTGISGKIGDLSWRVSSGGSLQGPEFSARGQIGATLSFRPAEAWALDGSWTRPFQTGRAAGEEVFSATARWSGAHPEIAWTASFAETLRHQLSTGDWRAEHGFQADLRPTVRPAGRGELAPRVTGSARYDPSGWRWDGRLDADLTVAPVTLRTGVSVGQGLRFSTERSEQTLGLSLSVDHRGLHGIRPSLRWERSWTVLSHPRFDDLVTEKEQLSLQLVWDPPGAAWRDTLSIAWRPGDQEVTLTNRLTWTLRTGSVTAATTASLKRGELNVKTNAQVGLPLDVILNALGADPLGDAWGINVELAHNLKQQADRPTDQALFGGLTLAVRF